MLCPWFVQNLSVDGYLHRIPALDEVHGELFFSFLFKLGGLPRVGTFDLFLNRSIAIGAQKPQSEM